MRRRAILIVLALLPLMTRPLDAADARLSWSAAVKRYVASEPGAIGYVDPADVDDTVRVVLELRGSGAAPSR